MDFGQKNNSYIEIDEFLKLDFNRIINEKDAEIENLKQRLKILGIKSEGPEELKEEVKVDERHKLKLKEESDVAIEKLNTEENISTEKIQLLKNEILCLKNMINTVNEKHDQERLYWYEQMKSYVESLKYHEDRQEYLTSHLHKYKTSYEEQLMKTMKCSQYLKQIKRRKEDQIEEQRILIEMLENFLGQYLRNENPCKHNYYPEEWTIREKIEYLELKFIDEKRDKLIRKLLFENEQLGKVIENNFCEASEIYVRKRQRVSQDYYQDYLESRPMNDQSITNEKNRLQNKYREENLPGDSLGSGKKLKQIASYKENSVGEEEELEEEETNDDSDKNTEKSDGYTSEESGEVIADDEEEREEENDSSAGEVDLAVMKTKEQSNSQNGKLSNNNANVLDKMKLCENEVDTKYASEQNQKREAYIAQSKTADKVKNTNVADPYCQNDVESSYKKSIVKMVDKLQRKSIYT